MDFISRVGATRCGQLSKLHNNQVKAIIELIPKLPSYVLGFVASGQVTANDYETVLIPAVRACLKQHQKVRVLCHLGPAFSSFSAGAVLHDAKLV